MTEAAGSEPRRELAELWRDWLTQSERQLNAFLNESMSTDAAGRGMGGFVELYAVFQRNFAQAMERYLTMMNIPARTDIVALADTLKSIEDRLSRIEETLLIAADAVDRFEREPRPEPARTRSPWGEAEAPNREGSPSHEAERSGVPVPEELRR